MAFIQETTDPGLLLVAALHTLHMQVVQHLVLLVIVWILLGPEFGIVLVHRRASDHSCSTAGAAGRT